MYGDKQLEAYLDAVAEYEELKRKAGLAWQEAYLNLAKARLSQPISSQDHDPEAEAVTTIQNGELITGKSTDITGAWPSQALSHSQEEFVAALGLELSSYYLKEKLKNII